MNTNNESSPEYTAALEGAHHATRIFRQIQIAYRARKIGDAEFLAAKAEYQKASNAFDVAFLAEESASNKSFREAGAFPKE